MEFLSGINHNFALVKAFLQTRFKSFLSALLIMAASVPVAAQEKIITAGFQFKPMFSSEFFKTGPTDLSDNGIDFNITPGSGSGFGMVIRKGITSSLSMETGIGYVKRNYSLSVTDSAGKENSEFTIVGYEIPVSGLVFIQLSDNIYMNASLGFSLDFYPSDIRTGGDKFAHYSARRSWFSPSVVAGLGWEYRTEKSGYIYLGASYHRPFEYTFYSYLLYPDKDNPTSETGTELQGNYLSLDFKYFFHSDPEKRKKKTSKPDKKTR